LNTIGIDVGGVIMDRVNDDTDTSFFTENFLNTTSTPDTVETVKRLIDLKFGEHAYIVSKCGKKIQDKTLRWLEHHRFYERTGLKPERVHFCRKREEKAGICKELGITHFIDDRLEVLGYLIPHVEHLFLFRAGEDEVSKFRHHLPRVKRVESWKEVEKLILG
jgi:hypothetical protein